MKQTNKEKSFTVFLLVATVVSVCMLTIIPSSRAADFLCCTSEVQCERVNAEKQCGISSCPRQECVGCTPCESKEHTCQLIVFCVSGSVSCSCCK